MLQNNYRKIQNQLVNYLTYYRFKLTNSSPHQLFLRGLFRYKRFNYNLIHRFNVFCKEICLKYLNF